MEEKNSFRICNGLMENPMMLSKPFRCTRLLMFLHEMHPLMFAEKTGKKKRTYTHRILQHNEKRDVKVCKNENP